MMAQLRAKAPWWAIGLALILPALGGGYSTLFGWPQAALVFTLILGLQLTAPAAAGRLPWWYWLLGAGVAGLAVVWLWPGEGLVFLSPTRRSWPGPSGAISGVAADRVGTLEALFQALGFYALLGISLLLSDRPDRRRQVMRWMLACCGLVFAVVILVHVLHSPIILLPDVPVLNWTRLSYPFTGANLSAAFFVSCLPFGVGMGLVHSAEGRYLPSRRAWQLVGTVLILTMLALQLMTQNRWMWLTLTPFLTGGLAWFILRRRSRQRRLRTLFIVLGLTLLTGLFMSLFDPGAVVQRFVLLIEGDPRSVSRTLIWENAWNTFREYPLVGIGLGGFGEVCPTTAPAGVYKWPRFAHSEPLQWLAETGLVGMALLLVVGGGMVQTAWRQIRARMPWQERMPFAAAALLIGLACLVDFPLRSPALLYLFALYLGMALGSDRSAADIDAEQAQLSAAPRWAGGQPGGLPPAAAAAAMPPGSAPSRRWPGWVLGGLILLVGVGFFPQAARLFSRGQAIADFEAQNRAWEETHDGAALVHAAKTLFEAADRQPRWSAEALNTVLATSQREDILADWSPAVDAILESSPYHDSLYYFQARVALDNGDYGQAARLNTQARACAATNRRTLQKIAGLDWILAAVTIHPQVRAERLGHAQETTRWLLAGNPELLGTMAQGCHQLQIPLDDFLPAIPADWNQPGTLCQVCLDRDRPLTALAAITAGDLYSRAEAALRETDQRALLTRWDLQVLTTLGLGDAIEERMARLYHEATPASRPGVVADIRSQGWGVLTPAQWDRFTAQVENALPSPLELYQLGLLYQKLGQSGQARQCWLASYKGERTPQVAESLARWFADNSALAAACEYATEWTELDPANPLAWRYLAILAANNKDYLTARRAFDRYRQRVPKAAEADFVLHGKILRGAAGQAPEKTP